jgi:hypothetical protein
MMEFLSQNIHCSKIEKHGLDVQIVVCVETTDPLNQALSENKLLAHTDFFI